MSHAELVRSLRSRGLEGARLAFVLGSGLGAFAERLARPRSLPFTGIGSMPKSAVPGHGSRFVAGEIGGERVLVQHGRAHLYEGSSMAEVCLSVRAFAELGCRGLVLTNAAGGLRRGWKPPVLMRIADHIDLQGATPLSAGEAGRGSIYDDAFGAALDEAALEAGLPLERGVYAGLLGPSYETPAEVRMLAWMGADAVGMSTVGEAQAAHASGLRVAAVSCISNFAAGLAAGPLSHADVLEAAESAAGRLALLLECAVPGLAAVLPG